MKILLATRNKGKILEIKSLLAKTNVNLMSLDDFDVIDVEETGNTFIENACLKASQYAKQARCWAIADDSGLEVEALGNAPGVFSARYAGIKATDAENRNKLLKELENIDIREGKFVCVIAISNHLGEIKFTAEGVCHGKIDLKPSGLNGFGYDSVFIPNGFKETFGVLDARIKDEISHRQKAISKIVKYLSKIT